MTQSSAVNDRIEVHSSRLWALIHFNLTLWVFPARMVADHVGVSNNVVLFWLTPWRRTDEHLPMSHIAEVTHTRGLIWDQISVESSGLTEPARDFGPAQRAGPFFRRTRAGAAQRSSRHAAAASSPLNLSPCLLALITTVSPSLMRPERMSSASGSCTDF